MRRRTAIVVLMLTCAAIARTGWAAPADCWAMRKHGRTAQAGECFTALTRSTDAYERAEGFWGLEQWDQANAQFRLATAPAQSKPIYKVRWGLLLHERFNNSEAADLFHEALD